jgi:hypothetical protein
MTFQTCKFIPIRALLKSNCLTQEYSNCILARLWYRPFAD